MIRKPYEYNPSEVRSLKDIDTATALMIEGYALACTDLIWKLTGDSPCSKTYDPMVINGMKAHSYAFNMKDHGRHHDLTLYENVGEILEDLLKETTEWLEDNDNAMEGSTI